MNTPNPTRHFPLVSGPISMGKKGDRTIDWEPFKARCALRLGYVPLGLSPWPPVQLTFDELMALGFVDAAKALQYALPNAKDRRTPLSNGGSE